MNDYLNRAGRPAAQSAARVVNEQPGVQGPAPAPKKKKTDSKVVKAIVVVVAVVVAGSRRGEGAAGPVSRRTARGRP